MGFSPKKTVHQKLWFKMRLHPSHQKTGKNNEWPFYMSRFVSRKNKNNLGTTLQPWLRVTERKKIFFMLKKIKFVFLFIFFYGTNIHMLAGSVVRVRPRDPEFFKTRNGFSLENFYRWLKFIYLAKISIFGQNFNFWPKFQFLAKISIFGQNFNFWPKFRFLDRISIFDKDFNFWQRFQFLTKVSIFHKDFNFWQRFQFFTEFFYFW